MTMEDAVKGLRNVADWHYGKYEQTHEEDYLNDGDFLTAVANMLKAQAPKVMTKSELDDYISSFDGEARVWIEHRKLGLYCASLWSSNPSTGDKNFYDVMHECYFDRLEIGHWWRPWTSCPTKAQMEAVAWE